MEKIKNWLLGLFLACGLMLSVVGALGRCFPAVPPSNAKARVDSVFVVRHDTLIKLDTLLKVKVKYIDTSRIDTVHDILDHYIPIDTADNDGNQVISANQLREAVKSIDSLHTCIDMRKVDSSAIDSLEKIAKTPIEKAPSILDRAKDYGAGVLTGIAIRSFF